MTAKRTARFTPASLVDTDKECAFVLRIPTPTERDRIGARLYELGVTTVSQETIRATLIDELFKQDWSVLASDGIVRNEEDRENFNELYAEECAEFLDGYWQRSEVDQEATSRWQEQEVQRVLDEAAGAPARAPAPQPVRTIKSREHARAKLLVDDMQERSTRLRSLAARQMDYGRQNGTMMGRLHILSMEPKDPENWPVVLERVDDLITEESIDQLREHIGDGAWREIVGGIDGHYALDEEEEKNFDSPPEKPSGQIGSHERSGESESSDGRSTESPTTAAPTDGSETTIAKSSVSTSGPKAKK
jgi:hypothetical protein